MGDLITSTMEALKGIPDAVKFFRETTLAGLRPLTEFFDYNRVSLPIDIGFAFARISYNIRYFYGNYGLIVVLLATYAVLTNYYLLISIAILVFGFAAIHWFAPDATQIGKHTITRKHLYIGLFIIGIGVLWISSPAQTMFWIIAVSEVLILAHATLMEPGGRDHGPIYL